MRRKADAAKQAELSAVEAESRAATTNRSRGLAQEDGEQQRGAAGSSGGVMAGDEGVHGSSSDGGSGGRSGEGEEEQQQEVNDEVQYIISGYLL